MKTELPDLFQFIDGRRVENVQDWRLRRQELLDLILQVEYGRLPPVPGWVKGEELHNHTTERLLKAVHSQYRLATGPDQPYHFLLDVLIPPGNGPFPVILNGDGCWPILTDDIRLEVLKRGYILAVFDRTEIVPDNLCPNRDSGLYYIYPQGDFGALAAWAWGYHRCVDFLATLASVESTQIAITGHSRGGKAVLLAGATDERIALTAPNDSGCGGAGCFRWQGPDSETLADILRNFPYWFSPQLQHYIGKEELLPFDQHSLKALVAPRALLSTEALGDLWANPTGTWQTQRAAQEVFRFLNADEQIGIWYREGQHDHSQADWATLLDFADWRFRQIKPGQRYDINPYPDLPSAFSWSAPKG